MKISILLPYKENYSPNYPGAVSLFVSSMVKISKFKKNIKVYGSTNYTRFLSKNYVNISLNKKVFTSQTKQYINSFIKTQEDNVELIEVHNRPNYVLQLEKIKKKIVLYFHNDPNTMLGSKTLKEKIKLIDICTNIIFNSFWSKNQFLMDLPSKYKKSQKLIVIHQSIDKKKINLEKKQNLISFVGKLNTAKGYDIFGKTIIKILDKYPDWSANVIGDEPREEFNFKHKNLNILGFKKHSDVLSNFEKSSIAVVCSRWNEPFGRTSLEASSRGCAVIISNRGGLPETITNGIILKNLNTKNLFIEIENLIRNEKKLKKLQEDTLKNFILDNNFISKKIDKYRNSNLLQKKINFNKNKELKNLKIIHVTNFNERHNGRLFYNSGRRINNGFIRLNHSVLELSDRDIVSYSRKLNDLKGSDKLNNKLLEIVSNYVPDLIVFGHADLIENSTIEFIKKKYPDIKLCQWFLDRMDDEWVKNKERFIKKFDLMDANFCTTEPKSLKFQNRNVYYMPNCVDQSLEKLKIYKNNYFKSDVFFAMSHGVHRGVLKRGKTDAREKLIKKLIDNTPNVKFDCYGLEGNQPIWSDDFLNCLSQNKIGLNLSQGKSSNFYSSDRLSQLIGNGLMVVIDEKTKIGSFFNKNEIVTYKNISDLSEKLIKYSYDNKKRIEIAKNGRSKYFKYFNSKEIADYIINKTFEKKKQYYWEKFI